MLNSLMCVCCIFPIKGCSKVVVVQFSKHKQMYVTIATHGQNQETRIHRARFRLAGYRREYGMAQNIDNRS